MGHRLAVAALQTWLYDQLKPNSSSAKTFPPGRAIRPIRQRPGLA